MVLGLPGSKAIRLEDAGPLLAMADGPSSWGRTGASKTKTVAVVSAPLEALGSRFGELRIHFDVATFAVETPVRFTRFVAQQIGLVLAYLQLEHQREHLTSELARSRRSRYSQVRTRAAGILVRQHGLSESQAVAQLRRHALSRGGSSASLPNLWLELRGSA